MANSEHSDSDRLLIEAGAYKAFELAFPGREATEPLREKGGVLDPEGWCVRFAQAIYEAGPGEDLPRLASNVGTPWFWAEEVASVMGLRTVDCRS